jgi:hypothetical protein
MAGMSLTFNGGVSSIATVDTLEDDLFAPLALALAIVTNTFLPKIKEVKLTSQNVRNVLKCLQASG